ncbi:MAG: LamG-like jellyroll fold domain-containing protein, partial [Planctomycetota bacterium]
MADSYNELFGLGSYSEDASLEGWWKLQDNAASTAVADSSSQATDQVLVGGSNTSDISASGPGFLPLSLNFDGTSDFCERAGIARSDVPLSLCARFEANTSSGAHAIVSWGGTADEHVLVQVNSEIWALSQTTTNARAESPALVSTGSWQSAVAVFEAAAIRRIFVDGVLRATNTQSIA